MSLTHLEIKQGQNIYSEPITGSDIDKIYNLVKSSTLDGTSDLQGILNTASAYDDAVSYLMQKFPNLTINAASKLLRIKDPVVVSTLGLQNITVAQAATMGNSYEQNPPSGIKGLTTVTSFDELRYFKGLTAINQGGFSGCTNLVSIKVPTTLAGIYKYSFDGCTSLQTLGVFKSLNLIEQNPLNNCTHLAYLIFNTTTVPNNTTGFTIYPFIYVPDSLLASFKSSWASSAFLIHAIGDTANTIPSGYTITDNNYLDTNGVLVSDSTAAISGYIPVTPGNQVYFLHKNRGKGYIIFYNSSKVKLSSGGSVQSSDMQNNIVVPTGAAYARICLNKSKLSTYGYAVYDNTASSYIVKVHPTIDWSTEIYT